MYLMIQYSKILDMEDRVIFLFLAIVNWQV